MGTTPPKKTEGKKEGKKGEERILIAPENKKGREAKKPNRQNL